MIAGATDVPGFRLDHLVGEGGFGQVWRATRLADGLCVAIKILHLELVRSTDAMRRFERELQAIQRLQHPNVVRALDHGELPDGRPYLVLEYLDGPSLRDVLATRGTFAPREMLAVLGPLCEALAVAHDAGLVHRDVKASNVILAATPDGERPVLLDFGLVKLLDDAGPGLTSSRSMLGTPAAMAPEQLRGHAVDGRADIYALGLLAYHMLVGQPAFGGGPGVVQSYLQVHAPRPRPSAKVDLDPAIDEPITRALALDPAARFASARDFHAALQAVIARKPTEPSGAREVVVLYVEGSRADLVKASDIAAHHRMIVATSAPDSMIAVRARDDLDATELASLCDVLASGCGNARVALGVSTATFDALVVDGDALDVESWAPYPLAVGAWIADALRRCR